MNGSAHPPKPKPFKRPHAPESITLRADIGVDRLAINAWIIHMRDAGREDLAQAAEQAATITVRRRWPKGDTPLPRIPVDFKKRAAGS